MFEDYFTEYSMLEPPKGYKLDFEMPEISDRWVNLTKASSDTTSKAPEEFPGLTNPFEADLTLTDKLIPLDDLILPEETIVEDDLSKLDIEDLLKLEGITEINGKPIIFGDKNLRTSNIGSANSWHRKKDPQTGNASARDISIKGGTILDYSDFKHILLSNKNVRNWMKLKNWGIINEVTPEILSQTKGTGKHFHFGPDTWAKNTWNAWINNPNTNVTMSYRNYSLKNNYSKEEFVTMLNSAYAQELTKRGLNPNFSVVLVALDALETGYGKTVHGNFNYGNITAGANEPWHKKTGNNKWRDFDSVEHYVSSKIDFLQRKRYNFFNTFTTPINVSVMMQTLANRGYDPGNLKYGKLVEKVYNDIIKYFS